MSMSNERLSMQQDELVQIIEKHAPKMGGSATSIPFLRFFCTTTPSEFLHTLYEPSLCLIAQGSKAVGLGEELFSYDKNAYLISSVHLPARVQIQEASPEKPYLSLQLTFSMDQILEIFKEFDQEEDKGVSQPQCGLYFGENSSLLLDPILRLVRLLENPKDINILAPMITREILYRIVQDKGGAIIRQFAKNGSLAQRVSRAITMIKEDFAEPLRIETLAQKIGMSSSSLHYHFKRVTTMSPLQFQKSLRLQEARRLLMVEEMEASHVAFQVGYESPSQFSREYARLFGLPPIRDIKRIREAFESA
ncbi:AraC family transcriptional regulator [Sulfurospirillum oryzae]|uniref:AraC family transcriptional regulator n=1 Tax=Sulfurospirillum oryzae TaxID=2976535 RepID=UPI0021E8F818|nr:AraC family transcriptional regulator [Sulfurospirillum oryzae]